MTQQIVILAHVKCKGIRIRKGFTTHLAQIRWISKVSENLFFKVDSDQMEIQKTLIFRLFVAKVA